jgi:hypothetical protein
MKKKLIRTINAKDFKKAVKKAKKNEVIIFDEATEKDLNKNNKTNKILTNFSIVPAKAPGQLKKIRKEWASQPITIKCTMNEASDLMDLLFMADASPFNNAFRDTLKLNKMEDAYDKWLNILINTVCPELPKFNIKNIKNIKILNEKETKNERR